MLLHELTNAAIFQKLTHAAGRDADFPGELRGREIIHAFRQMTVWVLHPAASGRQLGTFRRLPIPEFENLVTADLAPPLPCPCRVALAGAQVVPVIRHINLPASVWHERHPLVFRELADAFFGKELVQLSGCRIKLLCEPCRRIVIPSLYQVVVKLHLVGIGVDAFLLQVYFVALGDT